MTYFSHSYLSNSDLKKFKQQVLNPREEPENLQEIFDFGSLFHHVILEPTLADLANKDLPLALQMRDTYWADKWCRNFSMSDDFEREQEFYETVQVGSYEFKSRCKADGIRTRLKVMLELKGLSVENEKAFRDALVRFDYDQAIVHYMLTTKCDIGMIVGISKRDPRKLFKWMVREHDDFYLIGEDKLINTLELLRQFSPHDVKVLV
jgi:hypothetical protein